MASKFKLISKIPHAVTLVEKATLNGLRKSAIEVHADASRFAPVDSGRLRASITYSVNGRGRGFINSEAEGSEEKDVKIGGEKGIAIVGTNVVYAPRIEYTGHSKKAPNGFLRPAYDKNKDKIEKNVADSIEKMLKKL